MFPKENFSNGCIGTVDVLFPQAPFFLVFSPALTKAMLVPILDYAASPRWPYGYAPHDLGTYPARHRPGLWHGRRRRRPDAGRGVRQHAHHAGGAGTREGNADLAKKYWPMLTKWADYLVANGLDPAEPALLGRHVRAPAALRQPRAQGDHRHRRLRAVVRDGRAGRTTRRSTWPSPATTRPSGRRWRKDDGRTRLAYHLPGTWGMKHNLIWDRVLGLEPVPRIRRRRRDRLVSQGAEAIRPAGGQPHRHQPDRLGACGASRRRATPADFQALVEPLWSATRTKRPRACRCPIGSSRPTRKQKGFQARPVVGGIFIRLLADAVDVVKLGRAAVRTSRGHVGAVSRFEPRQLKEVVPTAQQQPVAGATRWRSRRTTGSSPASTTPPGSRARPASAPTGTPGAIVRHRVEDARDLAAPRIHAARRAAEESRACCCTTTKTPEVYLNGVLAAQLDGYGHEYDEVTIEPAARATLKPGRNVLAVRCRQTYGGQYIDVGLAEQ